MVRRLGPWLSLILGIDAPNWINTARVGYPGLVGFPVSEASRPKVTGFPPAGHVACHGKYLGRIEEGHWANFADCMIIGITQGG